MPQKNTDPIFYWDEETGTSTCIITDKNKTFTGIAKCAPEDRDMMSSHTGAEISLRRAQIKFLTHLRDNELKPQLSILKELHYSMNQSHRYNEDHFEAKRIKSLMTTIEEELQVTREMINFTKTELHDYIAAKEKSHKLLRDIKKRSEAPLGNLN